jgi:tetratricopeptide (TPR) repeat protein
MLQKNQDMSPKEKFIVQGFLVYRKNMFKDAVKEWEKAVSITGQPVTQEKLVIDNKTLESYLEKSKNIVYEQGLVKQTNELLQIGAELIAQKKYNRALEVFNEVLNMDPENVTAQGNINKCQFELDRLGKIKLEQSKPQEKPKPTVKKEPTEKEIEDAEKHYQQGLMYYASGQLESAVKEWESAIRLNPGHDRAKSALDKTKKELDSK